MLIVHWPGVCPKCGCMDIRDYGWYLECYKCNYKETPKPKESVSYTYSPVAQLVDVA